MRLVWWGMILIITLSGCRDSTEVPEISTQDFNIKEAYKIEIVASEPIIEAPIAIDWDRQGRLWVLEMPDYMPDIDGVEEHIPRGRILILKDEDQDGRMDHSTIFLDQLKQPRAIALLYGGLLYAESPNLWFVPIIDDQPGTPELVDSLYATGGNVEHQPNGLLLNIDNWIYNAKSNYRYRKSGEQWLKEPTAFRGQWGITNDKWGNIYTNDNSNGLYGDHVLPGTSTSNPHYHPTNSVVQDILKNRRIYPTHSTAINRGYTGVLDDEDKVQYMTSTCGPHISSGLIGPDDGFICVPEGNIIKRVSLKLENGIKQAFNVYENSEFLTSNDEAFRPVDINTGADGNLYVTDFHRGVIQHKTYMTAYLREKLIKRGLDKAVGMGRIWRVSPNDQNNNSSGGINIANLSTQDLINNLSSLNGEVRIKSQHELISRKDQTIASQLEKIVKTETDAVSQLHALYTLEGLGQDLTKALSNIGNPQNPFLATHAIRLAAESNLRLTFLHLTSIYAALESPIIDRQILYSAGVLNIEKLQKEVYSNIVKKYPNDEIAADMLMAGLKDNKLSFIKSLDFSDYPAYQKALTLLRSNLKEDKIVPIHQPPRAMSTQGKTKGLALFATHCAACHGPGGLGINGLAPALAGAAIVDSDNINHLALTLLTGLQGPVHINGTEEKYNAAMPGLLANTHISDDDIAAITSYVSNAFSKTPQNIQVEEVVELREQATKIKNMPTEAAVITMEL